MNFNDAITQLKAGKYVKRAGWTDGYVCLMPDQAYLWRILTVPQSNVGNFLPLLDDILASDWQVYAWPLEQCSVEVEPEASDAA